MYRLSEVVSFKVKREIKKKMEAYKDRINWSEELRRFVEEKIKELEARDNIARIIEILRKTPWRSEKRTIVRYLREDRDSR